MKKLVFTACVAAFSGVLFGQSFRMADDGRMNKEQSDLGKWYVTPVGGFMVFERDLNVKRTGYAALRLGRDVNDTLSMEIGGLVAPFIVSNPERAKHGKYNQTVHGYTRDWRGCGQIYAGTADALLHFDRENRWFDPYFRAGLGVYGASEHIFGDNFMAFVPRMGVGVMSHLTDNLALRADAIAHCFINDDVEWGGSLELGLVYRFGDNGAAAKPAAAPARRPAVVNPAVPALPGLVARTVKDDTVKYEYNLNFDYDAAVINARFYAALDEAVDTLKQFPNATASVEGHADQKTGSSAAYNKTLSENRAKAVANYLTGKGIAPSRVQSKGFGFDMPKVTPPDLKNGNPENRRVEILIKGAQ